MPGENGGGSWKGVWSSECSPCGGFAGSIGYEKVYAMAVPNFIALNLLDIF
jgi:hypothetical protein